jgi:hypothetical protein
VRVQAQDDAISVDEEMGEHLVRVNDGALEVGQGGAELADSGMAAA